MLTEHLCVLYVNKGGGAFARPTYYISHRNQLITQLNRVFSIPSASLLVSWTREDELKRKRWHDTNKVLSIGFVTYGTSLKSESLLKIILESKPVFIQNRSIRHISY